MAPKKKAAGDAAKGEKIFKTLCAVCHSFTAHGTGPNLSGVVGSNPASKEGFSYSGSMKAVGKPGPEELALLEPFRDQLSKEVFDEPWLPPVSDGSGSDRNNFHSCCGSFSYRWSD